jgi:hypothetical protein
MKLSKYLNEQVDETNLKTSVQKALGILEEIIKDCEIAHKNGADIGVIVTYSRADKIKIELNNILKGLR